MAVTPERAEGNTVRPLERLAVALAVALAGGVVVFDGTRQAGASAYFPIAVGSAMIVLSAVSVAGLGRDLRFTDEAPLLKGFAGLVLLAAFIGLSGQIGFLTASLAFIPAMAVLGGDRNVVRVVVGTLAFVVMAYVVFHLALAQPFPAELILGG
ncbi:tripartite tricarboxylate transporter TctB family protein [Stappia sp. ES.058]|uniref:tripartite tricarboxylate transporter TctB family protein n=1 Tax=Stappia sp. ES.058 TaxID=1881061 RepID=UPI00087961FB|nr:tripartite tricarboxylate transporter TctB family protein [Stappia sp. ES.058]SDU15276.1 Tripartite tricarboxylate transporter TctB family protein [Stappia sp. ES.058]